MSLKLFKFILIETNKENTKLLAISSVKTTVQVFVQIKLIL